MQRVRYVSQQEECRLLLLKEIPMLKEKNTECQEAGGSWELT
jgi:hypothetical protein